MSEKELDSHFPHLEQQAELDIMLEAEQMVDSEERVHLNLADGESGIPYTPQDPESRKKAIQANVEFLKSKANYENRSTDAILSDIVAWIDAFRESPERPKIDDALEREATALLKLVAEHDQESVVDPELKALAIRWATIHHVMYHHNIDWKKGITFEQAIQATERAGVTAEEFDNLITIPLNPKAQKLIMNGDEVDIVTANRIVIESRILELAEEAGLVPTSIHPYAVFQHEYLG